ncbi:hypothetical protein CRE_00752 [Caenorhabditis remanei]|uniref:SAP domain-containing protein n=1 Tax=Caenorhabditis remanei TaxID=31234 RepID=E3LE49_CAERE|nr:hypothetical protein CRE_00752 [Caenorhabditis remanei]
MEMLNQSISTPAQQQNNINGTDMISIGSYIKQQQRQQPSQMSGPHQRPSNGSNNFEQHAMIPATTGGDPANRVFNDQKSSINGHLHQNNSLQMPHQSMMEVQKNNQQSNAMMPYKVVNAGNSGRLPPLTLNSNNYSKNISVRLNNGAKDHNQSTFLNASIQSQPQMNHCEYNQTTITHNHVSSSLPMNEQLFDQQSGNSQQNMEASIRMNTPLPPHQHVDQQTQHVTYHEQNTHIQQQPDQTRYIRIADQNPNVSTPSMPMNQSQFQPALQTGNQMISSFQVNQTQEQVPHLSHMDQPPPTQHSMNSVGVPQSQPQQRLGQTGCNSNHLTVQNQSPANVPSNMSISSISSTSSGFSNNSAHKNSTNPMMSPTSIPMNANSTTQLLMAITNNSPITSEQLQEIQNMTSTAPDGTEVRTTGSIHNNFVLKMLLMQEPRLKQYGSLKDMSTTDLRLECKKRKLTSTGTKMRLCERMALYENEILDERNHQLMQEFTHRQQMYEAQSATLKAFQAKKALLQVQNSQTAGSVSNGGSTSGTAQSSSENSTLSHAMNNHNKTSEGPPAKKKRVSRPRKPAQPKVQKNAVKPQLIIPNASNQMSNLAPVSNDNNTPTDIDVLLGRSNSQPSMNFGNVGNNQNHQSGQNSAPVFGNGTSQTPGSTGFFMKDNSCFSHLGSGCRLISNSNDESQNSYGGTARAFQATVPPPPENAQIQLQQQNEQQMYNGPKQTVQQRMDSQPQQQQQQQSVAQSRPINLNQRNLQLNWGFKTNVATISEQMISNPNQAMYTISTPTTMQQQQQQQQQQHMVHPNQTIYMNSTLAQQNGYAGMYDYPGPPEHFYPHIWDTWNQFYPY